MFELPDSSELDSHADGHLFSKFHPGTLQLRTNEDKREVTESINNVSKADRFTTVPLIEMQEDKRREQVGNNSLADEPDKNETAPAASQGPSNVTINRGITSKNAVIVSTRQRQNPLLKFVRNVPFEFSSEILADYVFGKTTMALFLSLKYHQLNPEYIHNRMKVLGKGPELPIMLVWADVKETSSRQHLLRELNKICLNANYTLLLGWSPEELGYYVETLKAFEHKPPTMLMGNKEGLATHERIAEFFSSVKGVNKTDSKMLTETFGSVAGAVKASQEDLNLIPGFGFKKAQKLHVAFREPFKRQKVTK